MFHRYKNKTSTVFVDMVLYVQVDVLLTYSDKASVIHRLTINFCAFGPLYFK